MLEKNADMARMLAITPKKDQEVTLQSLRAEEPQIMELIQQLVDPSQLESYVRSGEQSTAEIEQRLAVVELADNAREERIRELQATLAETVNTTLAEVQEKLSRAEESQAQQTKELQMRQAQSDAQLAALDEAFGRRLKKLQALAQQVDHSQKVHAKSVKDLQHTLFTDMNDLRARIETIEVKGVRRGSEDSGWDDESESGSGDSPQPRHGSVIGISGELELDSPESLADGRARQPLQTLKTAPIKRSKADEEEDLTVFREALRRSQDEEPPKPAKFSRSKTSDPSKGSAARRTDQARAVSPPQPAPDVEIQVESPLVTPQLSPFGSRGASPISSFAPVSPLSPLSPVSPGTMQQVAREQAERSSSKGSGGLARRDSDPWIRTERPKISKRASKDDLDAEDDYTSSLRQEPDMLAQLGIAKPAAKPQRTVGFQRNETKQPNARRGTVKAQGGENAATPSMVDMIVTTKLTSYMKGSVVDAKLKKAAHKLEAKLQRTEAQCEEVVAAATQMKQDVKHALAQAGHNDKALEAVKLDMETLESTIASLRREKASKAEIEDLRNLSEAKADALLVEGYRERIEALETSHKREIEGVNLELKRAKAELKELRDAARSFASQGDVLQCRALAEKALRPAALEHLTVELGEVKAELDFRMRQLSLLVSKAVDKNPDDGDVGGGARTSSSGSNQLAAMSVCLYAVAKLCLPLQQGSVTRKQRQQLSSQLLHTLDGVWRWVSLQEQEDLQLDALLTFILSSEKTFYVGEDDDDERDRIYMQARKSIVGSADLGGRVRKSMAPRRTMRAGTTASDRRSVASESLLSTRSLPPRQLLTESDSGVSLSARTDPSSSAVRLPRISAQVVYVDDV